MSKECDFCEIGNEEDRVIRRTDLVTSFLSNPRLVLGHALIVPNQHVTLPTELSDAEVLAMHSEANRLTKIMLGSIALGVDSWQKTRPYVPEGAIKRNHLHRHLLPSSPGQPIYNTGIAWAEADNWTQLDVADSETQLILAMLRQD